MLKDLPFYWLLLVQLVNVLRLLEKNDRFCKISIKMGSDNEVWVAITTIIGAGYYCDFEEGGVQKANNTKLVALRLKFGL